MTDANLSDYITICNLCSNQLFLAHENLDLITVVK